MEYLLQYVGTVKCSLGAILQHFNDAPHSHHVAECAEKHEQVEY